MESCCSDIAVCILLLSGLCGEIVVDCELCNAEISARIYFWSFPRRPASCRPRRPGEHYLIDLISVAAPSSGRLSKASRG